MRSTPRIGNVGAGPITSLRTSQARMEQCSGRTLRDGRGGLWCDGVELRGRWQRARHALCRSHGVREYDDLEIARGSEGGAVASGPGGAVLVTLVGSNVSSCDGRDGGAPISARCRVRTLVVPFVHPFAVRSAADVLDEQAVSCFGNLQQRAAEPDSERQLPQQPLAPGADGPRDRAHSGNSYRSSALPAI